MRRAFLTPVFLAVTAPGAGAPAVAAAQAPAESIAVWTRQLQSGSLLDRVSGMGRLAGLDPRALPVATQNALVAEPRRINEALENELPVDGATELGSEGFGEYYLDLARAAQSLGTAAQSLGTAAQSLGTPDADRALILSVGVSLGTERRVARLGDAAIPSLARMIDRTYEPEGALETMGLAWFWADSTGAPPLRRVARRDPARTHRSKPQPGPGL